MNYEIFYPSPLSTISDITNDNIDVVIIVDGKEFGIVAVTPENLKFLMTSGKTPFLVPGSPFAIVESLTEKNIKLLVENLVNDPLLLRLYGSDVLTIIEKNQIDHDTPV